MTAIIFPRDGDRFSIIIFNDRHISNIIGKSLALTFSARLNVMFSPAQTVNVY